tara:strand:+ start:111 stop:527 length:417 start_codon:yes stop_codon:yes gene_type:complete
VRIDWETYALKLAFVASERSEDPWVKVGACALRGDNSIAGIGYNGAPPGIEIDWKNRDERRRRVVHAEVNALRYVRPGECDLLASTLLPCNDCLRMIASYGIKRIIFKDNYERDPSTTELAGLFGIDLKSVELKDYIL